MAPRQRKPFMRPGRQSVFEKETELPDKKRRPVSLWGLVGFCVMIATVSFEFSVAKGVSADATRGTGYVSLAFSQEQPALRKSCRATEAPGRERMEKEDLIQVELERSGGLIGIPRMFRIEVKNLNSKEQTALGRLIENADFFNLPESYSKTGRPDAFEYRLRIQGAKRDHTVVFHDQDGHPEILDELEAWVRDHQAQ